MPQDTGAGQLTSGDGRLIFAFSHDLRSHLRTVITRIQVVAGGAAAVLSGEDRGMLDEALRAAGEIDSLLTAMTAFCGVPARADTAGLANLVRGTLIDVKNILAESGARVEPGEPPRVLVPSSLRMVLTELLTNSCKFRRPQESLVVRLSWDALPEADGGALEVTVSDNGIGVDPQYAEKIFEPFTRLHGRSAYPGHGLGLAICRRTARSWGGEVRAIAGGTSGLSVSVRIPLTPRP